eukprot:UN32564
MNLVNEIVTDTGVELVLSYQFDGTDPGYPFEIYCELHYKLTDQHKFEFKAEVKNMMPRMSAPFYMAIHPYFMVEDVSQTELRLDPYCSYSHLELSPGAPRSGHMVPTGQSSILAANNIVFGGTKSKPNYFDEEYEQASDCNHQWSTEKICDLLNNFLSCIRT